MIIIGYPGIGKSTLAKNSNKYIDLESGNFWIDGERQDDWYKIYCKIATDLSSQGYTVFVSSHYAVRKELRQYSGTEEIKCCFPDISLRDEWIKKLEDRYHNSKLEKDYKAWQRTEQLYTIDISDMSNMSTNRFESICIKSMDYDLKELIENKESKNSTKLTTDGRLESLKRPIPIFVISARNNRGKSLIQMRDFINHNSIYGLNPNPVGGFWDNRFKLYFGTERATGKYKTTCRWKDSDTTIIRSDESVARIPVEYTVAWCYVKKKFKTTPQFKKYVDSHSFVKDNITYFEGGTRVNWAQAFANNRTKKYDIYDTAALAITAKHYGGIKKIMDYCDNEWWGSDQVMKEKKEWQK